METPKGVVADGINLTKKSVGSDAERLLAGCLDVAHNTVADMLLECSKSGMQITGKDIEHMVRRALKKEMVTSLKDDLEKAGFKIPEQ